MVKKDFTSITKDIKKECLCFGCGCIQLDKDKESFWINDYENTLRIQLHVDTIKIEYDIISLCENGHCFLTYDNIHSINRQIQIYETIYEHKEQLHYYELDWTNSFQALRVIDEDGFYIWRILTDEEARHLWFNGKGELYQLYDDGSEGAIEDEDRLNLCIEYGHVIGILIS